MRRLLVLGSAPCLGQDIANLDLSAYDVAAVNRAGLRYLEPIRWWVTYHPTAMTGQRWREQRRALVGDEDYQIVLHSSDARIRRGRCGNRECIVFQGPSTTGSSTLLAVLFGLQRERYDSVLVAGAPLEGDYETFQAGWIQAKRILAGRVRSMSGWTKTFLDGLSVR